MQIDPITSSPTIAPTPAIGSRGQVNLALTAQSDNQFKAEPAPATEESEITFSLSFPKRDASETGTPAGAFEEAVKVANISLNFSRDEETGAIVTKLVDQTSGETVQQIPTEASLHLAAAIGKLQGQILDTKA